ncbi:MAG: hypothetical protein ACP5Q4_08530 [Candidatus Caldatribacteriaceae bacterium]
MARLEDLKPQALVRGVLFDAPVAEWYRSSAVELTYELSQQIQMTERVDVRITKETMKNSENMDKTQRFVLMAVGIGLLSVIIGIVGLFR